MNPKVETFRRQLEALREHEFIRPHLKGGVLRLADLSLPDVAALIGSGQSPAYYFLLAATPLNRTSVRAEVKKPAAQIVAPNLRRAFVIKEHLPEEMTFDTIVAKALGARAGDLGRSRAGGVEQLFRDRLAAEGIGVVMTSKGNLVRVPSLLVGQRKPDGAYPHPSTGKPPRIYLEVKNVKRVSDDIQKRMYEIAQASLEMKLLYGDLSLRGLDLKTTVGVESNPELRARIRAQIEASPPAVVALLLCPRAQAERYRSGLETFIDRVFFEEEIEACLAYLKAAVARFEADS